MGSSSWLLLGEQEINSFISSLVNNFEELIVVSGGFFRDVILCFMYFLYTDDFKPNWC